MDIKLKNRNIVEKISVIIITIICLAIIRALWIKGAIFELTVFIIVILGAQLFLKELKLLFGIISLNEFINMLNREKNIDKMKGEMIGYPNFLRLGNRFHEGIIGIIDGVKELKKQQNSQENDIEVLIDNVIENLDEPVKDLKAEIEELNIENVEEKIVKLRKKEEVVEKLVLDIFKTCKSMNDDLPIEKEEKNLNHILKQICGEFSSEIENSKLKYEINIEEKSFKYSIDVEKFCEIIEILLYNAEKHSLENSRVYIESKSKDKVYNIQIKNISKEKLNIDSNEIKSLIKEKNDYRVTGLDLERCKNLIKALDGKFEINIDGDLFKVEISFKREEE